MGTKGQMVMNSPASPMHSFPPEKRSDLKGMSSSFLENNNLNKHEIPLAQRVQWT